MPRRSDAAVARHREHMREYQRSRAPEDKRLIDAKRREKANRNRPFIGWDGEGENYFVVDSSGVCEQKHRYILFGCYGPGGHRFIWGPGLSTTDCLDLLLSVKVDYPEAWHVIFSGDYDVNMILADLEPRHLFILTTYGKVRWNGFKIWHIPHKKLTVSKDGISVTIFDSFGFFHCRYITALEMFEVGTKQDRSFIRAGKEERGTSVLGFANKKHVLEYWKKETSLFPPLMDVIRELCYDAGLLITQWHGPGALASYMLRINGVDKWHSDEATVPVEVKIARQYAFAGGWFLSWRCGLWDGPAWFYDVNSAYLYAASLMPRLDNGKWQRTDPRTIDAGCPLFGLYRIRYVGPKRQSNRRIDQQIHPLFYRDKTGLLMWPRAVEGWYWGPEARNAIASGYAQVLEAWVYLDDGTKPFEIVNEYYRRRMHLKNAGNPAQKTIKWGLAAWYGQFARRVGWDTRNRKAPRSHQIEWAGFITSYCRAMVYRVGCYAADNDGLVSIDTDGVATTVSIPEEYLENGIGDNLGQWTAEKHSGLLHWQNGVYWLRDNSGEWQSAKARGVPRGRIDPSYAMDAYSRLSLWEVGKGRRDFKDCGVITAPLTRFQGYRQIMRQRRYGDWRTWKTETREYVMGGRGKTNHFHSRCRACRGEKGVMHSISMLTPHERITEEVTVPQSCIHSLPWLEETPDIVTENTEIADIYRDLDLVDEL